MIVAESIAAALLYFYPLAQYARTYGPVLAHQGSNAWQHQNSTSNTASSPVTRPNADTIYSLAAIDLSETDVTLTIPTIHDRTHIFPFHDFYGDNFATLGSFNNASAGRWLLRLASPGQAAIQISDEDSECRFQGYTGCVNFPTTYGSIFPRLLLLPGNEDIGKIQKIQNKMIIESTPKRAATHARPRLTNALLGTAQLTPASYLSPTEYGIENATLLLEAAARTFKYNAPTSQATLNSAISQNMTLACRGDDWEESGSCPLADIHQTTQPSWAQIQEIAQSWMTGVLNDDTKYGHLPGDTDWKWSKVLGRFGSDWLSRATITSLGYLATDPDQYVSPSYVGASGGGGGSNNSRNNSIILTFQGGRPPLKPDGFWSVTLYGEDGLFVDNPLNRYSLGDRSNLTYPDGRLVYPWDEEEEEEEGDCAGKKSAAAAATEPFQILIQSANEPPPRNWTSNWLPSPANPRESYGFYLRFYGDTPDLTDGSYRFPNVTTGPAFVS